MLQTNKKKVQSLSSNIFYFADFLIVKQPSKLNSFDSEVLLFDLFERTKKADPFDNCYPKRVQTQRQHGYNYWYGTNY